ncbi:MAG TPA: hypothetical protein VEI96_05415 [Thermodesulfovibrionales bacterium]|nr:hypothetical protein [Thermodesulfovibrionales bacterium]
MKNNIKRARGFGEKMRGMLMVLVITIAFLSVITSQNYAKEGRATHKIISGVITNITTTSIEVNGKFYDISNAILVTTSGTRLTMNQLKRGNIAEIFTDDETATKVRIDNRNLRK